MATKTVNIAKGRSALKPKLMKFKVKAGHHYHGDLVWTEGMVVSSRFDLAALLTGKFERVGDETPVDKGLSNFRYERTGMREMPDTDTNRKQISSDPESGFEEEESLGPTSEQQDAVTDAHFNFLQGAADVTDMFPFVLEEAQGLQVLQNGSKFGVVHKDNPRELLNAEKPLKKAEVVPFVEKFLDG